MNVAELQLPTTTAWQLEYARLVAFPVHPPLFMEQNWWQALTRAQPDDYVSMRKKNRREERGSFQGVILSLMVEVDHVEWLVQPGAESEFVPGGLPTIGSFREKIDWFVELLGPWLATSCPPLVRLAFCAKLLQPAANAQEAYQILAALLPAVNLSSNPNDFAYHVNRRAASREVPGLQLNRLSTWSKLNFAVETAAVSPRAKFSWPDKCYSAVELDVNTAPEWPDILPHESMPGLFKELVALGVEISVRGDTPGDGR